MNGFAELGTLGLMRQEEDESNEPLASLLEVLVIYATG